MTTIHRHLTQLAAAGLLAFASGCCLKHSHPSDTFVLKPSKVPEILSVSLGSKLTLEAPVKEGTAVQWQRNGEPIPGATGRKFTTAISSNDVGWYNYVALRKPQNKAGLTERSCPVEVQTFQALSSTNIIVWGKPGPPGGGEGTTCPGPYVAYVTYRPRSGFGWLPTGTGPHVATDGATTCSKVEFLGYYGDTGCAPGGSVTVPHPTFSPSYRFTIYFPAGCTWTPSHPIVLTGFIAPP